MHCILPAESEVDVGAGTDGGGGGGGGGDGGGVVADVGTGACVAERAEARIAARDGSGNPGVEVELPARADARRSARLGSALAPGWVTVSELGATSGGGVGDVVDVVVASGVGPGGDGVAVSISVSTALSGTGWSRAGTSGRKMLPVAAVESGLGYTVCAGSIAVTVSVHGSVTVTMASLVM